MPDLNSIGHHPDPPAASGISRSVISVSGVPTGSGYFVNQLAFDVDGGDWYKWTGTEWELVSSGGGGGGDPQVFRSTSNPVSNPGVSAAVHYRTDTGNIWVWSGSDWLQIL